MRKELEKTPREQGAKDYEVGNKKPPKNRQFGQPEGNPRHNGAWKKEDTLRYKWEKMLEMDDDELLAIKDNPKSSRVEKMTAEVLLDEDMKSAEKLASLEKLANQVYGMPKQINENKNIEIRPILPMKEKK